ARGGIGSDVNVGPSIVVIVRGDRRHGIRARGCGDAGRLAHISESPVAVVVKQLDESGGQTARTAIHGDPLPGAVGILAWLGQLLKRGVEIVGHEQVQPPIAIVVHPGTAGAVTYRGLAEPGLFRHVGEGSVAVIAIEHVIAIVGNKDVVESVVVVVGHRHGRRPAGAKQPGIRSDIGKRSIAIIFVQAVGGTGRRDFQASTAENEQVHPAIVVVVNERHAAPDYFDDVALAVNTTVNYRLREACKFCDISKASQEGAAGRLSARLWLYVARGDSLTESGTHHGASGRRSQSGDHLATRDFCSSHWTGSIAFRVWLALTFSNFWTIPEGHWISTSFAMESAPKPTSRRLSLAER